MASNKPWWQFYYKDYLIDTLVLSPEARGSWITALCTMRKDEVAQLSGNINFWIALFNSKTPKKTQSIIEELKEKNICGVTVTQDNKIITLISRRIKRELRDSKNNRMRQQKYRDKRKSNGTVTAHSHINKSHINKKKNKPPTPLLGFSLPEFINPKTWQDFLDMRKSLKKPATLKAQELLIRKLTKFHKQDQNPNAVLEQSIINSWQNVFPLKEQENPKEKSDFDQECKENNAIIRQQMQDMGYKPEKL